MRQEIRLLGEVQVFDGRRRYYPPADKRLGLLGFLACQGGRWVERERVAFLFWPDVSNDRARTNLRSLLARCRTLPFATELESDAKRVRWPVVSDVNSLREALERGAWHEVIDLYRGELLGETSFDWTGEFNAWLSAEREALKESYRSALFRWAAERHEAGATLEAVARLEELLGRDPVDEEAARTAMSLLIEADRGEAALRIFRNLEVALHESLEVRPGADTTILAGQAEKRAAQAAQRSTEVGTTRPPRPLTSFVGREQEVARIAALLAEEERRLVTLTGAGGVGKTRLALRVGELLEGSYEHGVAFVSLDGVNDPERVPAAVVRSLGLTLLGQRDVKAQLIDALSNRQMLLIIDNFEQVVDATEFLEELLEGCPAVDLLITSRERLGSPSEWLVPLDGLAFPAAGATLDDARGYDAVRLFSERARQVRGDFELDERVLESVLEIARVAAGLPLALELAAVWLRVLSTDEVVTELERNLGSLDVEQRGRPERHRSIRAAFEHSFALLSEREKGVLVRLAPFKGGFRREAAAAVAQANIPLLAALVDKSLIHVDEAGRYDMHPLLRQFTAEKLAQEPGLEGDTRKHHASYYAQLAEESGRQEGSREEREWTALIAAEYDNLCVAMEWAESAQEAETGLRLIASLNWYWAATGMVSEPRAWLGRMLQIPGSDGSPLLGPALHVAGWKSALMGDLGRGRELCRAALEVAEEGGDQRAALEIRAALADMALFGGEYDTADRRAAELLESARKLGDESRLAQRLLSAGLYALMQNRLSEARTSYEQALKLAQRCNEALLPVAYGRLGLVLALTGELDRAADHLQQGHTLAQASGNAYAIAVCSLVKATFHVDLPDAQLARELLAEGIRHLAGSGDLWHTGLLIHEAGVLEGSVAEAEAAACLWGAVEGDFEEHGMALPPFHRGRQERWEQASRQAIGDRAFEAAMAKGRRMGLSRAIAFALEHLA